MPDEIEGQLKYKPMFEFEGKSIQLTLLESGDGLSQCSKERGDDLDTSD